MITEWGILMVFNVNSLASSAKLSGDCHFVNGRNFKGPFPTGLMSAMFGMGCFWGVEKAYWDIEGVWVTAVGYSGGSTSNPTYEEVCSGATNHNEVVFIKYNPKSIAYADLVKIFWEGHNPTQGNRQGNDFGTQYRSGIYTYNSEQYEEALSSRDRYAEKLLKVGLGPITTEIKSADIFYYAEDYHQQYLAKNPGGYCGLGGIGILL